MEQNKKIIANAVSAYFMIFISLTFLLNKNNKYLNNDFVKSHTKTAFIIHIMFLFTYIIFVSFGFGKEFSIFSYGVHTILASAIFILLLAMLLYGIYRANKGEVLTANELMTLSRSENLISVEEKTFNEQEKISIILSYIPLLGYIIYGQNYTNPVLKNINKIALIAGIIITLLYISSNNNLAILFTLLYIVFVVFSCMVMITKDELLSVNLDRVPTPSEKYTMFISFGTYMKNYFGKKKFIEFKEILKTNTVAASQQENTLGTQYKQASDLKLPKLGVYIPFIVLAYLPSLSSRYGVHIKNSLGITILVMLSWAIFGVNNLVQALALFPITYGIGYIERIGYKMPFVYDVYSIIFEKIFGNIFKLFKKGEKLHKLEKTESLKVEKIKKPNATVEK